MNRKGLKYKCFNSKCNSTTPRPDDRLFGVIEYVCDKCSSRMEALSIIDLCVICNKDTPYDKDVDIDQRQHYVEGSGQLCEECWTKTYDADSDNTSV